MKYPWNLDYWKSGEWQVVNERLHDMEKKHERYNPDRRFLFAALSGLSMADVRVAIVGQDPYPLAQYATGFAFSIPAPQQLPKGNSGEQIQPANTAFPPTLQTILKEYSSDLGYPVPYTGDLNRWSVQGVLLWNAIPSCASGRSLSQDWDEWSYLTREIITKLSDKGGVVFAFLGSVARRFADCVDLTKNSVLCTSHPSPRGNLNSKTPFTGSRIFTTINDKLVDMGQQPINWRLDDAGSPEGTNQGPNLV